MIDINKKKLINQHNSVFISSNSFTRGGIFKTLKTGDDLFRQQAKQHRSFESGPRPEYVATDVAFFTVGVKHKKET